MVILTVSNSQSRQDACPAWYYNLFVLFCQIDNRFLNPKQSWVGKQEKSINQTMCHQLSFFATLWYIEHKFA